MTNQQHPIPTTERLPDPGVRVLAWVTHYLYGADWCIAYRERGDVWNIGDECLELSAASHWQPLPPDPTGEA